MVVGQPRLRMIALQVFEGVLLTAATASSGIPGGPDQRNALPIFQGSANKVPFSQLAFQLFQITKPELLPAYR